MGADAPSVPPWVGRIAGSTEPGLLCRSTAAEMHRMLSDHLICVSVSGGDDDLVVHGVEGDRSGAVHGLRFPIDSGVGGLAMTRERPVSVAEYASVRLTPDLVDVMVDSEGVRGAASYPLCSGGRPLGVLFAGRRDAGVLSERELDLLCDVAGLLGPLIGSSLQVERRIEQAVADERRRIAEEISAGSSLRDALCAAAPVAGDRYGITQREHDVLRLLARGLTSSAIAGELFLSVNTVRSYAQSLLRKLDAHSRIEAVAAAHRLGLL